MAVRDVISEFDEAQLAQVLALHAGRFEFVEDPVTVEQFIKDPLYAGEQGADVWPGVLTELINIFGTDPTKWKNEEAVLVAGQGSGKSYLTSWAITYMLYWVLNLRDPQAYFGMARGERIMFVNQSIREEQARIVVFHQIRERVLNSPWFLRTRNLPSKHVHRYLWFPKNIAVFPGSSAITAVHGFALLGGALNEAAHFNEPLVGEDRKDPPQAIYDNMKGRIMTRFANRGMLIIISSPTHIDDFMERHYRFVSEGDPEHDVEPPPRVYFNRYALWDMKPGPQVDPHTGKWLPWNMVTFEQVRTKTDGEREVLRSMQVPSMYLSQFKANPEASMARYAAIVQQIGAGYIWDPDMVLRPWDGIGTPGYNPDRFGHPFNELYQMDDQWRWRSRDPGILCHAHVDLALSRDKVGIAMGHLGPETIIQGEIRPTIITDFMLEYGVPHGMQVDFEQIRQLLYAIKDRGFPLAYVTFDSWGSIDMIQTLNKHGIETEVLSVDTDMIAYETLKEALNQGRIDYYAYKPFWECLKSLIVVKGRKVDHTAIGKKDVSDAMAGMSRTLTERWAMVPPAYAGRTLSAQARSEGRRDITRSVFS